METGRRCLVTVATEAKYPNKVSDKRKQGSISVHIYCNLFFREDKNSLPMSKAEILLSSSFSRVSDPHGPSRDPSMTLGDFLPCVWFSLAFFFVFQPTVLLVSHRGCADRAHCVGATQGAAGQGSEGAVEWGVILSDLNTNRFNRYLWFCNWKYLRLLIALRFLCNVT